LIYKLKERNYVKKNYIDKQMGKHSIENERNERVKTTKKKSGFLKFLKVLGIIILILILILVGVGIGGYIYINNRLGTMNYVHINKDDIEINEGVEESLNGYRTIALFGVDSREEQLEKGTRSDCIMLAVIDQKNKKVNLVSVYRDTYLQIPGRGLDKVTHAYAYGGPALSLSTLNSNLDLNITEFATVNFDSLVDIVNAVGGIKINISSEEIKYINDYIDATSQIVGKSSSHISQAGTQTLDGVQAVAYSRIRYTAGGDYKRTERMRTVLMAIADKAKTMNVSQLNNLANIILPKVYTNIKSDELLSLLPQAATYSFSDSIGWPYETKGITLDRWYGVPVTLQENVKKLHKEVFGQTDYEVSNKVKTISESIVKKTGYK
jgi:LCP family protein required for cell wall assembly